jgi:multidrug resistance efflux pump
VFRQRIIPVLIWGLAITIFLTLNNQQSGYQFAIGIVEVDEVAVAPLGDGTVRSLRVDLFDFIQAGDIVAMMDDTLVVAELAIEEAQLAQIRAELDVERKRLENNIEQNTMDQLDDLRRYRLNEEQARLEYVEISVDIEADQVKLERLKIQMDRQEHLVDEAIGDVSTYDNMRLRHEELKQELESNQETLRIAKSNAEESTRRRIEREAQSSEPARDTLLYLEPYLQELKVQEARRQEIQQERLHLVLRAPISGQIAKMFYGPGETILSGTPLLTIQSSTSNRVIAYVDEKSATGIRPGTEVQLRSTARPGVVAIAKILRAGSSLEEIPSRIWSTPIIAEWGFPILIGDVPDGVFLPGETVNVRFEISDD